MTMNFPRRSQSAPLSVDGMQAWVSRFSAAPVAAGLRSAVLAGANDYVSIRDAHARIAGDKTLTDGGRLVRQAKFARTKMVAAIERLATARAKAAEVRTHLDRELSAPFDFKDRRFVEVELAATSPSHRARRSCVSTVLSPAQIFVSSSLLERATMSQKSSLPQPTRSVS
jgi:hypothetical protein